MNYKIRLANINDCNELSKLKHDVWNTTYRGIYPDEKIDNFDYENNANTFKKIIENPDIDLYVIEFENKIVGYMDYGVPHKPFKSYKQEIGLLYFLKEYQGHGLGSEVFKFAYNKMKEKEINEFFVACNKYNLSARKFYEKMGGEIIDTDEDNDDKSIPQVKYLYKIK